jgi:hypothetical protein
LRSALATNVADRTDAERHDDEHTADHRDKLVGSSSPIQKQGRQCERDDDRRRDLPAIADRKGAPEHPNSMNTFTRASSRLGVRWPESTKRATSEDRDERAGDEEPDRQKDQDRGIGAGPLHALRAIGHPRPFVGCGDELALDGQPTRGDDAGMGGVPRQEEVPLGGGGLTEVVRVGETVRRRAGAWTPAVQALLRHLEAVGFPGAARSLGTDSLGREVLAWVEGVGSDWYTDDDLMAFGHLVRELHDATTTFAAPPVAPWQRMVGAPADGPVICHNDLSPDNAIRTADGLVLIDWDLAAPGTRLWDVAWAAYRWVPLYDAATCSRLDIPFPDIARLRVLADSYGLDADARAALLTTVEARLECLIATARTWCSQGRPGWVEVWRDTGGRQWQSGLDYVRSQRGAWEQKLR